VKRLPRAGIAISSLVLLAALLTLGAHALGRNTSSVISSPQPPPPPLQLSINPPDGAHGVALNAPVSIAALNGRVSAVQVSDPAGHAVPGTSAPDGTSWTSLGGVLAPKTTYTLAVDVIDAAGHTQHRSASFTTLQPTATLTDDIEPTSGTVGVGMPIVVKFNQPVVDKAAVQKALVVQMSNPVLGAWNWISAKEVRFRPQAHWPSGEHVSLSSNLAGVNAGNGVWGLTSRTVGFTVGDVHISTVDINAHQMTVTSNGAVVQTFRDSAGRDKYPTMGGFHIVLGKEPDVIMDSQSVGIPRNSPDGYYEHVAQDVNISDGGEFVHAAPWSVGAQGNSNVSHGCVNLAPNDATWFYNFSQRGDLINVVNSPRPPELGDSGTVDWNTPWDKWVAGSALPVL
jgi:lipoprotein-anchoring transpeptidase ErfK/SrfK